MHETRTRHLSSVINRISAQQLYEKQMKSNFREGSTALSTSPDIINSFLFQLAFIFRIFLLGGWYASDPLIVSTRPVLKIRHFLLLD